MRKILLLAVLAVACDDPMGPGADVFVGTTEGPSHVAVDEVNRFRPIVACVIAGESRESQLGRVAAPAGPYCLRVLQVREVGDETRTYHTISIENVPAGTAYRVEIGWCRYATLCEP